MDDKTLEQSYETILQIAKVDLETAKEIMKDAMGVIEYECAQWEAECMGHVIIWLETKIDDIRNQNSTQ